MSTLTPDELLRLYTLEKITPEQAVGHLLQHLVHNAALLAQVEKLKRDVERLKAFTGMEPESKPKHKARDDEPGS